MNSLMPKRICLYRSQGHLPSGEGLEPNRVPGFFYLNERPASSRLKRTGLVKNRQAPSWACRFFFGALFIRQRHCEVCSTQCWIAFFIICPFFGRVAMRSFQHRPIHRLFAAKLVSMMWCICCPFAETYLPPVFCTVCRGNRGPFPQWRARAFRPCPVKKVRKIGNRSLAYNKLW